MEDNSQADVRVVQANCPLSSTNKKHVTCKREDCYAYMVSTGTCVYVVGAKIGLRLIKPQEAQETRTLPSTSNPDFQKFYEKNYEKIFRVAYRMLKNRELAEEIAQEVFIKVYISFDIVNDGAPLSAWLYRVATNLCLDELRKQNTYKIELCSDFDIDEIQKKISDCTAIDPEKIIDREEERCIIEAAFKRLPENYCQVLIMRCVDKLSYEDIAYELDTTMASVRSMLFRARKQFIELYQGLLNEVYDEGAQPCKD